MRKPASRKTVEATSLVTPRLEGAQPGGAAIVALAGSPNVGKSSVFNALTGLSQHVGNWPGKTIEQKTGIHSYDGKTFQIVDLPGTYSLTANSPEEQIARDYIIREHPDVVVVVVNAANLERTLYLVAEALELPAPVVVALNMVDVAESQGMRVEAKVLQAALGVPVVPMVATRHQGLQELDEAINQVMEGSFPYEPRMPELGPELANLRGRVEQIIGEQAPHPYPSCWLALKLLEGDKEVTSLVRAHLPEERWQAIEALLRQNEDAVIAIASARYEWIGRMVRAALTRPRAGVVSLTDRLDRLATHPYGGLAILLGLLGLIFWLVYQIAEPLVGLLEAGISTCSRLLGSALVGAPAWLVGLLTDGILGGVGTVLSLLPILAVFFLAIGFLEDVGYLARGAFVADRFMHRIGLHGKSFLPLFLGLGCNVPAVLGSRILDSKRDRLLTTLLVPLVPCAGRMAVLTFVAGALFGRRAPLVILGLLAFAAAIVGLCGMLFNRLLFGGESPLFIMELPLYHLPNWRIIGLQTWQRLAAFVVRAGTLILSVSVIVWALAALPSGAIEQSYLAHLGRYLAPLGRLIGLDWRMMVTLLASFAAKEQAVATLAILTAGQEETLAAVLPRMLTPAAGVAFLAVQMLFVPCMATVATIRQEAGWHWAGFSLAYQAVLSFTAGIVIYQMANLLNLGV